MARYTNTPKTSLKGINAELVKVQDAFEDVLDRRGDGANFLDTDLDMNSQRILNLPEPVYSQEPVRLGDVKAFIDDTQTARGAAIAAAEDAQESAEEAAGYVQDASDEADRAEAAADVGASYLRSVQSIEDLKNLEVDESLVGMRIRIKEYHAGTGYGGGEWEVVAGETANGMDIVQSNNNGSIQFLYKGYPSMEAIGGGVDSDGDTNADVIERLWVLIQNLTAAPALKGGVVELGYGYYEFSRPIIQPGKIVVIGKGRGATWVIPSSSFTGDYLWRAGDVGLTAVTTCELKDVALDAESVAGLVAYYSNSINEHSGLNNCLVKSNAQTAVLIDKADAGAPNNFYIKDTEVYVSNSNNTVDCIKLDMGGFQFREIYNVTVIGDKFTSTTAAGRSGRGIAITASGGAVINYHGEACLELLSIGGDGSAFGINCSNITDLGTSDKAWRVADTVVSIESGSANITLNNIDRTSAVNCINDKDSGTVIQDAKVAMYYIGGGGSGSKTVLTTSRNTRQILNQAKIIGNLTVNQLVISSDYTTTVNDGFVEVYGNTDITLHDSALNPTSKISVVNAGGGTVNITTSSGNLFYGSGSLAVSSLVAGVGEVITFTASDFGVGRWYFKR